MIKCPNCGTENPLGRIHCSGCSRILEISELRPEVEAEKDSTFVTKYVIKRIILLVILIAIVAVFVAALWQITIEEPNLETQNVATENAIKIISRRRSSHTFASKEVQLYLNKVISETAGQPTFASYTPQVVNLTIDKDGFQLILKSAILDDNFNIYTTLEGTIDVDKEGIVVNPDNGKLGKLPMPAFLISYLTAELEDVLTKSETIHTLTTVTSKIKLGEDKVMIMTAPKKK